MTHRSLLVLALVLAFAAAPSAAFAGAGFTVPSGNTTCGILTATQAAGGGAGLYCSSAYVKATPPAEMGGAKLRHSGNYGMTFKRDGYTCVSRSSGLTCRRGSHGFFLSREHQRYF